MHNLRNFSKFCEKMQTFFWVSRDEPMRTVKFCMLCEMRNFVKFCKVSLQKNLTKFCTSLLKTVEYLKRHFLSRWIHTAWCISVNLFLIEDQCDQNLTQFQGLASSKSGSLDETETRSKSSRVQSRSRSASFGRESRPEFEARLVPFIVMIRILD